jgi:hypothetical protein
MLNKIQLIIAGICILLATLAAWKVAKWKYQQEALQCKIKCQNQLLEVVDQQKEIFTTNEKIIVKYKKIAEINRSRDIIDLIDEL